MSPVPPHLRELNAEQADAVTCIQGPLLILAGAGSGKTRVLTRRVAHLLHAGVPPWQIMALTFTNKAAGEMRQRVQDLVGESARQILVSTFHSACVRFLRRDAPRLGYERSFVIYDDDDQIRLLKSILTDMDMDPKRYPPKWYRERMDRAKNALKGPEDLDEDGLQQVGWRLRDVFNRYQERMKAANAMDFNDLVNNMVVLLEQDADVRREYQRRYQYLLVDEYQDTNHAQYRLVLALAGAHRNLAVVGDDDQSIYSFRGADINNILSFEKDFPEAHVVRLEKNYRSTANILAAASSLVSNNEERKEKTLWTDSPPGRPVEVMVSVDQDSEAQRVVSEIGRLLAAGHRPGDMAIIYRTNAASRPFEQVLAARHMDYLIVGAHKFYERREVRDLVAYLRLLVNPADDLALQRIINRPPRGIGDRTVEEIRAEAGRQGVPLLEAARRTGGDTGRAQKAIKRFVTLLDSLVADVSAYPASDLVLRVAETTGYLGVLTKEDTEESRGRLENIQALAQMAAAVAGENPTATPWELLRLFLDQASLSGQADELPDDDGRITLLTAHLAKGLEFPVVFVVGMVEGSFPHARSVDSGRDLEEERRLAYVAFTRARQRLYLSRHQWRIVHLGGSSRRERARPSRFLAEIPNEVLGTVGPASAPRLPLPSRPVSAGQAKMDTFLAAQRSRVAPTPPARAGISSRKVEIVPEALEAFQPGVRVKDRIFGEGVVLQEPRESFAPRLLVKFTRFGVQEIPIKMGRLRILQD